MRFSVYPYMYCIWIGLDNKTDVVEKKGTIIILKASP